MIKIFGIERTCTDYVKELLIQNFGIFPFIKEFGYKHDTICIEQWIYEHPEYRSFYRTNEIKTIICVKNPYHWLYSIRDYCDKVPEYGEYKPDSLLKRYNAMYLHWHNELIERQHAFFQPVWIFRYEELLKDFKTELLSLNLPLKDGLIEMVNPEQVRISDRFTEQRRQYYLTDLAMDDDERRMVNRLVSDEFFKLYGYERKY